MSLPERMIHTSLLIGLPLICWEVFDLWREARANLFFGTSALIHGLIFALLAGLGGAVVTALIEHGLVLAVKKYRKGRQQGAV